MTDPVTTMAAGAIVNLAFQKFAEAGGTELAKKFTEAGIQGIEALWQKIRGRLWGKSPKVNEALMQAEGGDQAALETISKNLDVVMDEDEAFAAEVRQLAREITLNIKQGDNAMNQTVLGGNAWQTAVNDGGVANQAGVINQYYGKPED